jgi:hypothetical protein
VPTNIAEWYHHTDACVLYRWNPSRISNASLVSLGNFSKDVCHGHDATDEAKGTTNTHKSTLLPLKNEKNAFPSSPFLPMINLSSHDRSGIALGF